MQSVFGEDAYPTLEEKVARLLYFVVRNHPFNDGSKRSGAFAFVWFLRKAGMLDPSRISPEALTTLTLLIAESDPKEREVMVGGGGGAHAIAKSVNAGKFQIVPDAFSKARSSMINA